MRTIGYDDDEEDENNDDDGGEDENDKQGTLLHLLCCLPRKHSPSSSGSLDCICIPSMLTIIMMMLVMMMVISMMQALLWVSVSILLICSLEMGCLPLIKGGKFCNLSFIRLQIGTRMYHNYLEKVR